MAEELEELGVKAKRIVFDTWYFALKLITRLRDLGLEWVTRSKKNRLFAVDGETLHAEEVIQSGVKETAAELPGYGPVKLMVAEIDDKKRLLVTSGLKMKRKEVIKVYRDRFQIDNPFFRDSKQEMGLSDFHTRSFRALVAHTAMCFLSHTLVSLVRLFNEELVGKSAGGKENLLSRRWG